MNSLNVSPDGISITEGKETVSLSREEMSRCRHSLDVVHAIEVKLGHSLRNYYYFKYNVLDDCWECTSGSLGPAVKPKDVLKEVPVIEYVDRLVEKEVIKEVPVEKLVYVDKPVPVDRIVEVEKIVYVDKPVYVDKIVDRIVESERKVYVDRVVEVDKPIDRIVEVPIPPTMKSLWAAWKAQIHTKLQGGAL